MAPLICINYVQAIGRNCGRLQSLNLGWCENVGDIGVMSLAYGCPDLRSLDLCGCVHITGILCNCCVCHQVYTGLFWLNHVIRFGLIKLGYPSNEISLNNLLWFLSLRKGIAILFQPCYWIMVLSFIDFIRKFSMTIVAFSIWS